MYRYAPKNSACNTGLNSVHASIKSVTLCPILLKASGMLQGKNPSSGSRFEHGNSDCIKPTYITKVL